MLPYKNIVLWPFRLRSTGFESDERNQKGKNTIFDSFNEMKRIAKMLAFGLGFFAALLPCHYLRTYSLFFQYMPTCDLVWGAAK